MRTTMIACIATVLFSVQAFAAENTKVQNGKALTVELPTNVSMNTVVQDVSGYLAMQGNTVKVGQKGESLLGQRVDGLRFEVLFKKTAGKATVECTNMTKTDALAPSQKHKLNGRRFKKANAKAIQACTEALALSVKKALK